MHNYEQLIDARPFYMVYPELLRCVLNFAFMQTNRRTRERTYTLPGGVSFRIRFETGNRLPVPGNRKVFPATAATEICWFLSGSQDIKWLHERRCHIWDKFAEEDGSLPGSYGFRWRRRFMRDQILRALSTLEENWTDRQVVVSAWDPYVDGLGTRAKNTPCPTHFTLNIVQAELHMSVFLRSSDIFVGLPYDVMGHAMLLDMFATSLGVTAKTLQFTLANAHVYSVHMNMLKESLRSLCHPDAPIMPGLKIQDAMTDPDNYISIYRQLQKETRWPEYNPKPEIIQ